jgi:hypothetical protein
VLRAATQKAVTSRSRLYRMDTKSENLRVGLNAPSIASAADHPPSDHRAAVADGGVAMVTIRDRRIEGGSYFQTLVDVPPKIAATIRAYLLTLRELLRNPKGALYSVEIPL